MVKNFDIYCFVKELKIFSCNLTTKKTIKYNEGAEIYNYETLLDFIDEHSFKEAIDMINQFKLKIYIGRPTDLFINFKGRLYIDETKINNKTFFIPKIET